MSFASSDPYKRLVWHNILFFGITPLGAFITVPLYAYWVGFTPAEWWLAAFMCATTMMATTFGYHRLFAHRAFKAHPAVVIANLFFGAAAFEQSALTWSSQHRDHHRFTDTDRDPYNIKKGFFHAHMGWFLFREAPVDYENVKDLSQDRVIRFQHEWWLVIAIAAGFVLPLFTGLAMGNFWGVLAVAVFARYVLVHQCVFLINSACHMFGTRTYDEKQTARDSWVCALLTNGEGYHNYHHRFPTDYRNGVRWYHWDPTKWLIGALGWMGLTWDLKKTPDVLIHEARIQQEHRDLVRMLQETNHPKLAEILQNFSAYYENLLRSLKQWEEAFVAYRRVHSAGCRVTARAAKKEMKKARSAFLAGLKQWETYAESSSRLLSPAL